MYSLTQGFKDRTESELNLTALVTVINRRQSCLDATLIFQDTTEACQDERVMSKLKIYSVYGFRISV